MLTFGSLFAGIGGLDLGLERAGMRCVWQVEVDDYATAVLAKHWPDVERFRDVRDCGTYNLQPVDLICGGFPCQDVSLAGRRQGLKGERTTLWSEFARIIGEVRPRWVLAENVPGLLSSDSGRFFGAVLRDLATLGYDAEWDCIPAAAVGAPHRRDRVFIVAYAKGIERRDIASDIGHGTEGYSGSVFGASSQDARYVADATSLRCGEMPHELGYDGHEIKIQQGGLLQSPGAPMANRGVWATEPNVGRVADGVPARVERLRCLGNAVVPQVAEWIGRRIVEHAP